MAEIVLKTGDGSTFVVDDQDVVTIDTTEGRVTVKAAQLVAVMAARDALRASQE